MSQISMKYIKMIWYLKESYIYVFKLPGSGMDEEQATQKDILIHYMSKSIFYCILWISAI